MARCDAAFFEFEVVQSDEGSEGETAAPGEDCWGVFLYGRVNWVGHGERDWTGHD